MFCIKLAGIPIGIDNRYAYVRRLCAGYETSGRPAFTVRASEREIRAEQGGQAGPSRGYCESLCLYRQICRYRQRLWPLLERLLAGTAFYLLQCNREPEAAQLAYESMRRKK